MAGMRVTCESRLEELLLLGQFGLFGNDESSSTACWQLKLCLGQRTTHF